MGLLAPLSNYKLAWPLILTSSVIPLGVYLSEIDFSKLGSYSITPGGGALTTDNTEVKSREINLENQQIKKILESRYKQKETHEITTKPLNLDFPEQELEAKEEKPVTSIIEDVHSEINREEKVILVDEKQKNTSKSELSKLQSYISDFKDGLKLISNFKGEGVKSRSSRSMEVSRSSISPVAQKQRIAFRKFYESFDSLTSEGKKLFSDLITVSSDPKLENPHNKLKYSSKEISRALQRINWDGKEVEFKSRGLNKNRKNSSGGNYGWGNWDNNPFRFFYESENIWREKVASHDSAKDALESYMTSMRFPCLGSTFFGAQMVEKCYSSKSWYEDQVKKARGEIEQHISKWLLGQMRYSI